jgi:hypothetical protein
LAKVAPLTSRGVNGSSVGGVAAGLAAVGGGAAPVGLVALASSRLSPHAPRVSATKRRGRRDRNIAATFDAPLARRSQGGAAVTRATALEAVWPRGL